MLQVELTQHGNSILFRVISQGSEVRRGYGSLFIASNRWTISSMHVPEICLHAKTIFLGGTNRNYDNVISLVHCGNIKDCTKVMDEVLLALDEFYNYIEKGGPNAG